MPRSTSWTAFAKCQRICERPRCTGADHSRWRERLGILRTQRPPVPARTVPPHRRGPRMTALTVSEALSGSKAGDRRHLSRFVDQRQLRRLDRRRRRQPGLGVSAARARRPTTIQFAGRSVPRSATQLAYEELLIAEGSDWCWWYGPEHDSANRPEFDQLFRGHLANVYTLPRI